MKKIQTPLKEEDIRSLETGDEVFLTGTIFTARDQAHLRMAKLLDEGKDLPVDLKGQIVYYCGPTPSGDRIIGACGPTTSSRMDKFTPKLIEYGLKATIGKGARSEEVTEAMKDSGAVYFITVGGAGAYLSERVLACEMVAFGELGPEAIYKLEVKDFPLVVAVDSKGNNLYKES